MGATYKLKRKKADGTLEDVILQGVITDLGEQEDNALAEQAILELLKPTSVPTGSHFFYTYHTTCRNDAVMALCSKTNEAIHITYISSISATFKYSYYDLRTEELQNNCWRSLSDLNPSFESVNIGEYNDESQCDNQINAQGFYINLRNESGNSYLSFNINDGVELVQYDGTSLVLNGGYFSVGDSDGSSLIITPSAITHNENEYQFPNESGTLATENYVGNGTITIKQAGTVKGTFTTNQSGDTTIELGNNYVTQTHTTTNSNYPLLFKQASGITTTEATTNTSRYANNIYVNPATGTVYANDFVVDGQSIVGGGGGGSSPVRKISSGNSNEIEIDASTLGAYFRVLCYIDGADELYVNENSFSLDSDYFYTVSIEGNLFEIGSVNGARLYYWNITVMLQGEGEDALRNSFLFTTTDTYFYIGDTGQSTSSHCRYSGTICD